MVTGEPDWRELYTEARTTLFMRDAEIYTLRNSLEILREREPVTAMIAFGVGGIVGALMAWLVLV